MDEIYEKVKDRARLVEKIELFVPGFRGYKEKEIRRESDRIIREYLLRKLNASYEDFKGVMTFIAMTGNSALFELYNQVQAVFDRMIAKLRTADYGYAGFFDAMKIEEPELDRLIEFDYGLVEAVERITRRVAEVREAAINGDTSKLVGAMSGLRGELMVFQDLLNKREDLLSGMGR